jgi:hypothetical protein
LLFHQDGGIVPHLFDSLLLSRYGESSSEFDSMMILDPIVGDSLEKAKRQ